MTTPYGFLTTTGREREADALANNTAIDVTHIAWGDDDRTITGGETALGNEVDRATVGAQGTVSGQTNVAFFRHVFAPADGPFTIHEAGLFASDGALLAIVAYPLALTKPINFELTLDLYVAFSDLQNLTINVSTAGSFVPSEREVNAGSGLVGGGDLSVDRSFAIDWTGLASLSGSSVAATNDVLAVRDASATAHKKVTVDEFAKAIKAAAGFSHGHSISDVTSLQSTLNGKASASHGHAISEITSLQSLLDAKAPLASPTLTGVPKAPTPSNGDSSTKIATTAFVAANSISGAKIVGYWIGTPTDGVSSKKAGGFDWVSSSGGFTAFTNNSGKDHYIFTTMHGVQWAQDLFMADHPGSWLSGTNKTIKTSGVEQIILFYSG